MIHPCPAQTPSGAPCAYPAETCPLHSQPPPDAPPAVTERAAPRDPRAIGQAVAEQVADGTASPLQASRLIRSLGQLNKLGSLTSDEEEQEILAEVELRGLIMNGFTPRDAEEWIFACKVFDADLIEELVRWERAGCGWEEPDMAWVPPIPEELLPKSLRGPQPAPGAIHKLPRWKARQDPERFRAEGWDVSAYDNEPLFAATLIPP